MPWFITSVIAEKDMMIGKQRRHSQCRCFGFFECQHDAEEAIEENRCNMQECLYSYIVVEPFGEGIHPYCEQEEEVWYKWIRGHRKWKRCKKPKEFLGLVNWAIG